MGEPIVGIPQEQMAQAAQDAAFSNALSLLTQEVWGIVGLVFAGIGAGMIVVGITRKALPSVEGDGTKAWESRRRFLFLLGAAVSAALTFWIEWAYLAVLVGVTWVLAVPAALLAALFAAGLNQPLFKPVKAIWKWALSLLRKRIESTGASASDLDDTDFGRKP